MKNKNNLLKPLFSAKIVLLVLAFCFCSFQLLSCSDVNSSDPVREFQMGALLPLSGAVSYAGVPTLTAIDIAIEEVNEFFTEDLEVQPIIYEDTDSDPEVSLNKVKQLAAKGIRVMIGPLSSACVSEVKDFADSNAVIIISPASVARSLSIPNDNVFRFTADDGYQAEAMPKMIMEDQIDQLIVVWRDDTWGNDLAGLAISNYEGMGGLVYQQLEYDPAALNVAGLLAMLKNSILEIRNSDADASIGIYLLSYSEVEPIFAEAAQDSSFLTVKWYGASAVAKSGAFIANHEASNFAAAVGFPCPIFAIEAAAKEKYERIENLVLERCGQDPNIYAINAYDAVWVACLTYLAADDSDVDLFKEKLVVAAENYFGATGRTALNENGDRKAVVYEFWSITRVEDHFEWTLTATYDVNSGALLRF